MDRSLHIETCGFHLKGKVTGRADFFVQVRICVRIIEEIGCINAADIGADTNLISSLLGKK